MDPGLTTGSELRAWGKAHAPLWAALRARTFAVQIVAIGLDPPAANRAETVLRPWTADGDGRAEATAAGPTKADPDVQQEMTTLEQALGQVDRKIPARLWGSRRGIEAVTDTPKTPRRHLHNGDPTRRH